MRLFFLIFCLFPTLLSAQDSLPRPKIFLNCPDGCQEDFLKTELSFFDFVRDRFEADIQILIIAQDNSAGGQQITLTFIGQKQFLGVTDTLIFSTKQADSNDMIRTKGVQLLKVGLIKYLAKKPPSQTPSKLTYPNEPKQPFYPQKINGTFGSLPSAPASIYQAKATPNPSHLGTH